MKRWVYEVYAYGICALFLAGCASSPTGTDKRPSGSLQSQTDQDNPAPVNAAGELPDLGPAPELENEVWLNSDQPLRLKDLHGKVVLLEFWGYWCGPCVYRLPELFELGVHLLHF